MSNVATIAKSIINQVRSQSTLINKNNLFVRQTASNYLTETGGTLKSLIMSSVDSSDSWTSLWNDSLHV
jgi:hypothetical protein